jgi:hypothetical protein
MSRLRAFLLWAVMLAVPFQGYAAASMALCTTAHPDSASSMEIAHAGEHDHGAHQHAAQNLHHSSDDESAASESDSAHKCGTCGICHAVALVNSPSLGVARHLPETDLFEPFTIVATTSPGVLDKPPRV